MSRIIPALAVLLGIGALFNGTFMLIDPANWYFAVPGVTTSGPFNQHFIRDIGMIYGFIGLCLIGGAAMPAQRAFLWGIGTIWLAAHALFHIWEVAVGICGPEKLLIDFPAVLLPPAITAFMTLWAFRNPRAATSR